MPHRCLICESTAVLSKDAANTAVMLVGAVESMLLGMRQALTQQPTDTSAARPESQLLRLLELTGRGMSEALSECSAITSFARDVQKYQFRQHDFLCLRCGALFNQNSSTAPHDL